MPHPLVFLCPPQYSASFQSGHWGVSSNQGGHAGFWGWSTYHHSQFACAPACALCLPLCVQVKHKYDSCISMLMSKLGSSARADWTDLAKLRDEKIFKCLHALIDPSKLPDMGEATTLKDQVVSKVKAAIKNDQQHVVSFVQSLVPKLFFPVAPEHMLCMLDMLKESKKDRSLLSFCMFHRVLLTVYTSLLLPVYIVQLLLVLSIPPTTKKAFIHEQSPPCWMESQLAKTPHSKPQAMSRHRIFASGVCYPWSRKKGELVQFLSHVQQSFFFFALKGAAAAHCSPGKEWHSMWRGCPAP